MSLINTAAGVPGVFGFSGMIASGKQADIAYNNLAVNNLVVARHGTVSNLTVANINGIPASEFGGQGRPGPAGNPGADGQPGPAGPAGPNISGPANTVPIFAGPGNTLSSQPSSTLATFNGPVTANRQTVNTNTFFGANTGTSTNTGGSNTFFGASVAPALADAADANVGIGTSSLLALTTGQRNTAVGEQSGPTTGTTTDSVSIGESAQANADATTAIGSGAQIAAAATNSVAIGSSVQILAPNNLVVAIAAQSMEVGATNNTLLGGTTISNAWTGNSNTTVGINANPGLAQSTNTCIGFGANSLNDVDNVCVGSAATCNSDNGTAVGANANSGSNSVAVGHTSSAGAAAVAIGQEAIALSGQVVIGRQANGTGGAVGAILIGLGIGAPAVNCFRVPIGNILSVTPPTNANALAAGLLPGCFYRANTDPDILYIVH